MMASVVPEMPPLEWLFAEVEAAAAVAEVGDLVLVGVDDVEVANVEEEELVVLVVVLEELVEAVFEASDASIDVTSV